MPDRRSASRLRQQIHALSKELMTIKERLLRPQRMIAASLIERHLGTSAHKRPSSAFYLSVGEGGRTRLTYVPKKDVERVRLRTEAWREYREGVRRFRGLADRLMRLLRELGDVQAERTGGGR